MESEGEAVMVAVLESLVEEDPFHSSTIIFDDDNDNDNDGDDDDVTRSMDNWFELSDSQM